MSKKENIVLIGAGNVASQLGLALKEAGHRILQVYSPGGKSALSLARKLKAESIPDLEKISKDATIYIIAVKDDAIGEVAKQLKLKDKIIVHTSGTAKMSLLKSSSSGYGVFYPLQTFSKGRQISFTNIPVCIEASSKPVARRLSDLAKSISRKVQEIDSDQRKAIHLAAVFASNFSNHMFGIAEGILSSGKMSFDILKPLILETAEKVQDSSPTEMQTGPAIRGDKKTMKEHLKLLKKDKELHKLYKLISESIAKK